MKSQILSPGKRAAALAARLTLLTLIAAPLIHAELPPLIPRETLFPKPSAMQAVRLSPDGGLLSYLAPDAAGTPQLWLRDLDRNTTRQLTAVALPGVASYLWAENGRVVCYEHREAGVQRLVALDLESGKERTLIGIDGAAWGGPVTRPAAPDELLVSIRQPKASEHDVYRVNLLTGEVVLDTKNPGGVADNRFFADRTLCVRAVQRMVGDGGNEVLVRESASALWRSWMTVDSTYNLDVEGFTANGEALLVRTDLGVDKTRLISRTIRDGKERVVVQSRDLDLENVLLDPSTGAVQAVSYLTDPRRWDAIDRSVGRDLQRIARFSPGRHIGIANRDRADRRWLVWLGDDHSSRRLCLWDRPTGRATLILDEQPQLAGLPLAREKAISYEARDGLLIRGYLTLPVGVAPKRLPLVVWVHGGPYLRDGWGYDNIGQLFANRGYAFLRINYRGSRGFGRRFKLAAFKQWGGAMQNDVVDGVEWAIRSGIADRSRIAIMGHSYGGYVVLAALTLTPDLFACGAASSTAANLLTFISRFPKTPGNAWFRTTIGDPEIPKEADMLRSVSPIFLIDRLSKPVLIARGDKDEALPPGDLDTFAQEAGKRGREAISVVYEGDGHFFRRENQLDFFARAEALLARCLGGRAEPMPAEGQPGSTARVKTVGK